MYLQSGDGTALSLRPLRFEFPGAGGEDGRWLLIGGTVSLRDARSWSFQEPCLTFEEARSLGRWLLRVGHGHEHPHVAAEPPSPYTEPNLAFELVARDTDAATIRTHLSAEVVPPWWPRPSLYDFHIDLTVPLAEVIRGAQTWLHLLESLRVR